MSMRVERRKDSCRREREDLIPPEKIIEAGQVTCMIGGVEGGQSFYAYRYGVVISVEHHNRINQLHQNCGITPSLLALNYSDDPATF